MEEEGDDEGRIYLLVDWMGMFVRLLCHPHHHHHLQNHSMLIDRVTDETIEEIVEQMCREMFAERMRILSPQEICLRHGRLNDFLIANVKHSIDRRHEYRNLSMVNLNNRTRRHEQTLFDFLTV